MKARLRTMAVIGVVLAIGMSAAARAQDPPYVEWSGLLPGLTTEYVPSSENLCSAGQVGCVDATIREMERRFAPLAASCDHDAIFALAYLRTTEEYRRAVEDPSFFEDNHFVNHEDAIFARAYFDAYDDWKAGQAGAVPRAWAIAFQAADDRSVAGAGDLLLGINAHVQRDLPFVLAAIGLVKPDGSSRKPDHDRVNLILDRVYSDMIAELAQRFDPTIDDANLPTPLDDFTLFQILPTWREIAWRNAERLVSAPSPAARAQVAAEIESYAASQALSIRTGTAYAPILQSSRARDAYCAVHHDG
jgi:Family of unknown function (DUF5995)